MENIDLITSHLARCDNVYLHCRIAGKDEGEISLSRFESPVV